MLGNRRLRRNRRQTGVKPTVSLSHGAKIREAADGQRRPGGLRDRRGAHSLGGEAGRVALSEDGTVRPVHAPADGMPPYRRRQGGQREERGCRPPCRGELAGRHPDPDGRLVAAAENEAFTPLPPLRLLPPREGAVLPGAARSIPALGGLRYASAPTPSAPGPRSGGAARPDGTAPGVAQPRQIGPS